MRILPLDAAMIPALHDVFAAAYADIPGPVTPLPVFRHMLEPSEEEHVEVWVAEDLSGWYNLRCPTADNTHMAVAYPFCVHPHHRRRGVGRVLLEHAATRARALGRRTITINAALDTAGDAFLAAMGAEVGLPEARRVLVMADVDWAAFERLRAETAEFAPGYTLERLPSPVPEPLLPDMAVLMNGMNDAPLGDLDREDMRWDAARYGERQAHELAAGKRIYTTLARHAASGAPAAFSTVSLIGDGHGGWARQEDTAALRAHRGHRLGLLVKLENALWLRAAEPEVTHIVTWNAESNTHMLAVNERMGFRVLDRWRAWEIRV